MRCVVCGNDVDDSLREGFSEGNGVLGGAQWRIDLEERVKATNEVLCEKQVMGGDLCCDSNPPLLGPPDDIHRASGGEVTDVQPGADIFRQEDIPGDNALLGNARPASQTKPGGQCPLVHLRIDSESWILGMLSNHGSQRLGLLESAAHDQRIMDTFPIVGKNPNGATAGSHCCHGREFFTGKAFGNRSHRTHRHITGLTAHSRNSIGDAWSVSNRVGVGHGVDCCKPSEGSGL